MNTFRVAFGNQRLALTASHLEAYVFSAGARLREFAIAPSTFLVCKVIIGLVSAYDIHQTIKYVEYLPQMELNPIGRWLMSLDSGPECDLQQAALFITAKFAGNFACVVIIELLSHWRRGLASLVAISVAAVQLGLLYVLMFAGK